MDERQPTFSPTRDVNLLNFIPLQCPPGLKDIKRCNLVRRSYGNAGCPTCCVLNIGTSVNDVTENSVNRLSGILPHQLRRLRQERVQACQVQKIRNFCPVTVHLHSSSDSRNVQIYPIRRYALCYRSCGNGQAVQSPPLSGCTRTLRDIFGLAIFHIYEFRKQALQHSGLVVCCLFCRQLICSGCIVIGLYICCHGQSSPNRMMFDALL
ncbi:hypothetical protein D3C71_1359880 [compost metagenome]